MKNYKQGSSLKSWALADRPREKLMEKGKSALSETELLAILIGSGYRNVTAVELARSMLAECGNDLQRLVRMSTADLMRFKGIGKAKAIAITAAFELARRRQVTQSKSLPKIGGSRDAYEALAPYISDLPHEEFWLLMLNRANRMLRTCKVSSGGVSGTVVDPKIVFKKALEQLCSAIILCHNHPSGNLRPSQADIDITRKISQAGKTLDIRVLDHIIVGINSYFSFADEGLM